MFFYIETETIKKSHGFVYYWTMMDALEPDEDGTLSAKSTQEADCDIARYQRLSYVSSQENMGRGTPKLRRLSP